MTRRKNHLLNSSPSWKLAISTISIKKVFIVHVSIDFAEGCFINKLTENLRKVVINFVTIPLLFVIWCSASQPVNRCPCQVSYSNWHFPFVQDTSTLLSDHSCFIWRFKKMPQNRIQCRQCGVLMWNWLRRNLTPCWMDLGKYEINSPRFQNKFR